MGSKRGVSWGPCTLVVCATALEAFSIQPQMQSQGHEPLCWAD